MSLEPRSILDRHARWALGVQVDETGEWGMGGTVGCDAFASPARGYAYGYVTRHLGDHARSDELIEVLDACLDQTRGMQPDDKRPNIEVGP